MEHLPFFFLPLLFLFLANSTHYSRLHRNCFYLFGVFRVKSKEIHKMMETSAANMQWSKHNRNNIIIRVELLSTSNVRIIKKRRYHCTSDVWLLKCIFYSHVLCCRHLFICQSIIHTACSSEMVVSCCVCVFVFNFSSVYAVAVMVTTTAVNLMKS